ncbi:UDP-N-acetylmuramate dehydrogenase [Proteinivorax hydrogeniformans]|uniref:UDP-N-acetylenolpyruvoylglucosamine reductase n=1 Tax=Proteinivorax hydrogeniformans TaxID=1826727 RepID=A0AAU8HSL4_9FIRM
MDKIVEQLTRKIPTENVKTEHILAPYTTFEIGGPAEFFVIPSKVEQISWALDVAAEQELPYYVLGKGSNLLIDDKGLRGVVIYLGEKFTKSEVIDEIKVKAQSGATLESISLLAMEHSLAGLEFAVGIPGSVGGGVFMNAGAYEGQMGDVVCEVTGIVDGKIKTYLKDDMEFGYRSSTFQKDGTVILEATIGLEKGNKEIIKAKIDELSEKRKSKQPLNMPSAGSVFKRPEGYYAGKLIQDCGLRGFSIGGAQVSEKHCGFIVNKGAATSQDVKDLVAHIQRTVKDKFGVELQRELKYI